MLTAYWDLGLQIKDLPVDDPRIPLFPFESWIMQNPYLPEPKSLGEKSSGRLRKRVVLIAFERNSHD